MFSKYLTTPAPMTGPSSVPAPPRMVISTTSPDAVHCMRSVPARGSVTASRPPISVARTIAGSGFMLSSLKLQTAV